MRNLNIDMGTHSEMCHLWHPGCFIYRLDDKISSFLEHNTKYMSYILIADNFETVLVDYLLSALGWNIRSNVDKDIILIQLYNGDIKYKGTHIIMTYLKNQLEVV